MGSRGEIGGEGIGDRFDQNTLNVHMEFSSNKNRALKKKRTQHIMVQMVVCYAISFLPVRLSRIFSGLLFLPQKPHTLPFGVTFPYTCTALHSLPSCKFYFTFTIALRGRHCPFLLCRGAVANLRCGSVEN